MRTPRPCSHSRSAPVTTASTTSLTVPPSARLMRLNCARSPRTHSKRRCEPISALSGTSGAGLTKFQPTSPSASAASATCPAAALGCSTARSIRRRTRTGALSRPSASRAASSAADGGRPGAHERSGSAGSGTGSTSKSTVAMSTPETPSTSAWCVLVRKANRLRVSPWTSHSSQSGFVRSSACEKTRAALRRSCSSDPGAGSAEWRTWYSRLNCGSSTQYGRPVGSGG